jgi:hypothetical protein
VVAKNLGHADTRMVEKHYGHLAPSFITDALSISDGSILGKSRAIRKLPSAQVLDPANARKAPPLRLREPGLSHARIAGLALAFEFCRTAVDTPRQ